MVDPDLLVLFETDADSGEGWTVAELVEKTGWTENRVRKAVKTAIAAGTATATRKRVASMDGRLMPVPSYVFSGGGYGTA
jgi:hypothetical protein